ncbi:pirin family protein [Pseudomonas putida]|uniref:pirin family protein n=1 Tax=Pseudomonas putida TaxID=303 RepID=UPI0023636AA3|nr:pirin family protein [Pseudomonas putida]MDD1964170.1 pirin family protein [Pseudomonas putida]
MIELRTFADLGSGHDGGLDTRHHFSFGKYHDPKRMNWGRIKAWNDNRVAPRTSLAPHCHPEMEIITYVRQGAITHQDSLGNTNRTVAGDVHVRSAGTGFTQSDYNHEDQETAFFQIFIVPDLKGLPTQWAVRPFPRQICGGTLEILASGFDGDCQALRIRADARLAAATLDTAGHAEYALTKDRKVYLVVASGQIEVNGVVMRVGDGAAVHKELLLNLFAHQRSEVLLVDVAY